MNNLNVIKANIDSLIVNVLKKYKCVYSRIEDWKLPIEANASKDLTTISSRTNLGQYNIEKKLFYNNKMKAVRYYCVINIPWNQALQIKNTLAAIQSIIENGFSKIIETSNTINYIVNITEEAGNLRVTLGFYSIPEKIIVSINDYQLIKDLFDEDDILIQKNDNTVVPYKYFVK